MPMRKTPSKPVKQPRNWSRRRERARFLPSGPAGNVHRLAHIHPRQYPPVRSGHVDILNLFCQCGDRKHEDIMESLELFAKEVMPEFKDRHHLQQKWREVQLDGVKFPINSSI